MPVDARLAFTGHRPINVSSVYQPPTKEMAHSHKLEQWSTEIWNHNFSFPFQINYHIWLTRTMCCFRNCAEHYEQKHQRQKLLPHQYDQWQLWESKRQWVLSTRLDNESEVNWRHEHHMILKKTKISYKEEELWQKWCAQKSKSHGNLLDDHPIGIHVLCHMQIMLV